jgi:VWFA-related protein
MQRVFLNWAAAMLFIVACWALVPAQEAEEVVRVNVALVTVNVAVTDNKGRHIAELRAQDFLVSDEGKTIRPEFFDTQGPSSIIFVVDTSSSMSGDKWKALKEGMKKFLATAREDNDYTLITFSDEPHRIADSVNAQLLWREFNSLKPTGNTALYDGLLLGLSSLDRVRQRHKSLVLLSDGQDNSSFATLPQVNQELLLRSASIYSVGIVRRGFTSFMAEERRGQELLNELATATGGLVFFPSSEEIRSVLVRISEDLRNRYSLSYYPPDKTPGWRHIQVNLLQRPTPLHLRYQQRYLIK